MFDTSISKINERKERLWTGSLVTGLAQFFQIAWIWATPSLEHRRAEVRKHGCCTSEHQRFTMVSAMKQEGQSRNDYK